MQAPADGQRLLVSRLGEIELPFRVVELGDGIEGARLPSGSVGRLAYRGPGVARGFFDDPAADAEAFANGFFFPGDLGEVDEAGFVSLRGRAKDMIIRGGVNIYPAEIESVLLSHESVAEVAVVGVTVSVSSSAVPPIANVSPWSSCVRIVTIRLFVELAPPSLSTAVAEIV